MKIQDILSFLKSISLARKKIKEQVENETYTPNQRIKVLIKEVKNTTKEPQIILSRKDKALVVRLFELEVPEITNGIIEIYGICLLYTSILILKKELSLKFIRK